jgi:hypothetical protein
VESMEAVTDASFNLGWPLGWPGLIWGGGVMATPGPPLRIASDVHVRERHSFCGLTSDY